MASLIGQVLKNRYRVDAHLGGGGMADVYRAFDTKRNYKVAIKVMRADRAEAQEFAQRFRQEAKSLAALAHENIVRFYSLDQDKDLTFLVMDYIEGEALNAVMARQKGPLPLEQVAHIFGQICRALHFAHEEGVVHRDIKPANIMLRPDKRAFVADFGIAKVIDAATVTIHVIGTPAYMSPEQCRGDMVDRQSDVYSLGLMLFEMTTGRRPFLGQTQSITGTTVEKLRWEQINAPPPSPRKFNSALPVALERVILKALAKRPEDRFSTALGLLETFEIAVGNIIKEPLPANPVTSSSKERTSSTSPEMTSASSIPTTLQQWLKSSQTRPKLAAIAAVIGLVILSGGGWWVLGRGSPATPTLISAITDEPTIATPTRIISLMARITRDSLKVREGPGEEYRDFASLDKGSLFEVTGRNNKTTWLQIVYPIDSSKGRGWIDADGADTEEDPTILPLITVPPPTAAPPSTAAPTPTATPGPTDTPIATTTPTRRPTSTPVPRLLATINGQTGGSFRLGAPVKFCFSSNFTTKAEVTLYYSDQPSTLKEFQQLKNEQCFDEVINQAGKYIVEIVALDDFGDTVVSKSFDFQINDPTPQVFADIGGGQICPNSCYDAGSQADWCFSSTFPTTSQVLVYFPNGDIIDLQINKLSSQKTCLYDAPMPVQQGNFALSVKGFNGPNGTVSASLPFKICDCEGK